MLILLGFCIYFADDSPFFWFLIIGIILLLLAILMHEFNNPKAYNFFTNLLSRFLLYSIALGFSLVLTGLIVGVPDLIIYYIYGVHILERMEDGILYLIIPIWIVVFIYQIKKINEDHFSKN